jgi:chemotaxis protein methyltransferase CheR
MNIRTAAPWPRCTVPYRMTVAPQQRHDLRDIRFEGVDVPVRPARAPRSSGETRLQLAARRAERTAHDEAALEPLLGFILEGAGLDPRAYRPRALRRRTAACLRQLGVRSVDQARAMLERDAALLRSALNAVLIGVTDFFRDQHVFERLEREVIPGLLRTRAGLSVSSVGCSTGQELYSVAMLLTEAGALTRSDLIGIDCRADALRDASLGWYTALPGVDDRRRRAFFEPVARGWRVFGALRDRATWREQDLFRFTLDQPADLLLFRNVAIYLDEQRAGDAWRRLVAHIAPGGCLVTGKAERPPAELGLVRMGPCLFRKP